MVSWSTSTHVYGGLGEHDQAMKAPKARGLNVEQTGKPDISDGAFERARNQLQQA